MRKVKITDLRCGLKDPTKLYALSLSGRVYQLKESVQPAHHKAFAKLVSKADCLITLKHWTKVKQI